MDRPSIILGIYNGRGLGRDSREVLGYGNTAEVLIAKEGLERDRIRRLALSDHGGRHLIGAAVKFLKEVLGLQECGDLRQYVIVEEECAQEGLLDIDIGRE